MQSDKVLDQVRKLLALAGNNPSKEEATEAMLKARRLMAKYNIGEVQLATEPDEVIQNKVDMNVRSYWMKMLATIIANNFRCTTFSYRVYKGANIVFMGHEADSRIAEEMYRYTISVMKEEIAKNNKRHGSKTKNDFILGFLNGLEKAFIDQNKIFEKESTALVLASSVPGDVIQEFSKLNLGRAPKIHVKISSNEHAREDGIKSGYSHGNCLGHQIEA
jgi:hypothetical protein